MRLDLESANAAAEGFGRGILAAGLVEAGHDAGALQVGRPGLERARAEAAAPFERAQAVIALQAAGIADQPLRDRFHAAARARMLAT